MKTKLLSTCAAIIFSVLGVISLDAQGTAFTYQGQLQNNGAPASGTYNFRFKLYSDPLGNNQIGGTVLTNGIAVSNGLFITGIDFGAGIFTGSNYWLEVDVQTNGASEYTVLMPLQGVTPTPYAIFATGASNVLGTVSTAQLSGTVPLAQLPAAVVTNNETSSVTLSNLTLDGALTLAGVPVTVNSGGALLLYADGDENLFVGQEAGNLTINGALNTAVGFRAFQAGTSGSDNTAYGAFALFSNTSGNNNVANGAAALGYNTSGSNNVANGFWALTYNTSGSYNTANGYEALFDNTTGSNNVANGPNALSFNVSGNNNVADGFDALYGSLSGNNNTAVGFNTLLNLGTRTDLGGTNNTALGYLAGSAFTGNESSNIDIGNNGVAGENNTIRIGSSQTATYLVGTLDLPATPVTINSGGSLLLRADNNDNFFAGPSAGNLTTSGNSDTGTGWYALVSNTSGYDNTAEGVSALSANTSGEFNTANGANALSRNSSGNNSTANGSGALYYNETGNNNTAIGENALYSLGITTGLGGTNNIAIGYLAGNNFSGNESSNIDIGNEGMTGDNSIIRIGTEGIQNTTFLVGKIGLNETNPAGALHITGPTNAPPDGVGSGDNGLVLGSTGTTGYKWIQSYGGPLVLNGAGGSNPNYVGICNENPTNGLLVVGNSSSPAYCNGTTWVNGSDRNSKKDFSSISPGDVLEKVSAMPITEWQYKAEADGTRHIGPMAQDFHAAFGLNGGDDKHISTVDEGGVALAAIQGLNEKLEEEQAQNAELKQELNELKAEVQSLKERN